MFCKIILYANQLISMHCHLCVAAREARPNLCRAINNIVLLLLDFLFLFCSNGSCFFRYLFTGLLFPCTVVLNRNVNID